MGCIGVKLFESVERQKVRDWDVDVTMNRALNRLKYIMDRKNGYYILVRFGHLS